MSLHDVRSGVCTDRVRLIQPSSELEVLMELLAVAPEGVPIWSPVGCHEAAKLLMDMLEAERSRD